MSSIQQKTADRRKDIKLALEKMRDAFREEAAGRNNQAGFEAAFSEAINYLGDLAHLEKRLIHQMAARMES